MSSSKVAVVTGANKGIGYAIVKKLCKEFSGTVILTARDEQRGQEAVKSLSSEGCSPMFHQLDIISLESIQKFKKFLEDQYGGLDILINNAGIAYKMASTAPFEEQAEVTVRTNFRGTLDVCHGLFPLLRPHARVVNVSSTAGRLAQVSEELQNKFKDVTLMEEALISLMDQFVQDVKDGVHKEKGWSNTAYGTSKIGVTALSKIQARALSQDPREDILLNAVQKLPFIWHYYHQMPALHMESLLETRRSRSGNLACGYYHCNSGNAVCYTSDHQQYSPISSYSIKCE